MAEELLQFLEACRKYGALRWISVLILYIELLCQKHSPQVESWYQCIRKAARGHSNYHPVTDEWTDVAGTEDELSHTEIGSLEPFTDDLGYFRIKVPSSSTCSKIYRHQ